MAWDDFVGPHRGARFAPQRFAFDHPWYVLFSSGTTGVPKCIVHRAGGVLLQHLKEHQLHCDIRASDRVMYFTTTGWMMWNWLVSVLASGATAVLYDGSPFHPGPNALFDVVDAEQLTLLGVSAKFIDSVGKTGIEPMNTHGFDALRTICSTGSPLSSDGFRVVYDRIKADVHLASIAGGTDLCGCLVGGDPTGPVYAGEIQRPALGMAVDVAADDGTSLARLAGCAPASSCAANRSRRCRSASGATQGGERYHAAYFERFPEVWAHGDFASWTEHGGMVIHGRSDATLNPGGVRIGTAEIYRVVESMPEVLEALAFGQQWHDDVRIVLLVRLADGVSLTDELVAKIRARVRAECSPRHAPAVVAAVDDLPAHAEQQAGRARGGRRGARPAGAQRRGAREPRGDRRDRGAPRARRNAPDEHEEPVSVARLDHVPDDRVDLRLPAAPAEHAVVPDARLEVVTLPHGPDPGAQVVGGQRLADGADVVALAFDGEERHPPDRAGVDPLDRGTRARRGRAGAAGTPAPRSPGRTPPRGRARLKYSS